MGDVDGDGYLDLYVTRLDATDILYRNNGDGSFTDVTGHWFGDAMQVQATNGALFGDLDNDGDLDLYVTGVGTDSNYLYMNHDGQYHEESLVRGAAVEEGTMRTAFSATVGDYDNDGYLDIYTTEWTNFQPRNHSRLLRNRGGEEPGFFDDVTVDAGLDIPFPVLTFAPRFTDLDRDGYVDLAIASDFTTSKLFWNNGDGTFVDGTDASGITGDRSAMGSTVGDYDNDGDLDWFIGNIDRDGNTFFENQLREGEPRTFQNVAEARHVLETGWSWGSSFLELDNDGDLDLVVTNGFPGGNDHDGVYLFRNDGRGQPFADVSDAALHPRDTQLGSGLIVFDYDNDGDHDVFIVNGGVGQAPVLYQNQTTDIGSFVRIETVGTVSNRDGFGAFITVTPDLEVPNEIRVWEVNAGSNFLGQNERIAHFGFGDRDAPIDLIEIVWPSGTIQQLRDVPVNHFLVAVEPVPEPNCLAVPLSLLVMWSARTVGGRRRIVVRQ